jgi:hypothetical protein
MKRNFFTESVLNQICIYLNKKDLLNFFLCCKKFLNIKKSNYFWYQRNINQYNFEEFEKILLKYDMNIDYFETFKRFSKIKLIGSYYNKGNINIIIFKNRY